MAPEGLVDFVGKRGDEFTHRVAARRDPEIALSRVQAVSDCYAQSRYRRAVPRRQGDRAIQATIAEQNGTCQNSPLR